MKEKLLHLDAQYTARVQSLLTEMAQYDDETLNCPSPSGGWSVLQNMHHLMLSETMSLRYVEKKLSFGGDFPKTGWSESWRYFLLIAFFSLPIKFKAPPRIGGNPEDIPAQSSLAETRAQWLALREQWQSFLQNMPPDLATRTVFKHVRAGKLGWSHMIRFYIDHFDRHYKQMQRAL